MMVGGESRRSDGVPWLHAEIEVIDDHLQRGLVLQIAAGHGQTTTNFFMRSRAKPQGMTAWAAVDFKMAAGKPSPLERRPFHWLLDIENCSFRGPWSLEFGTSDYFGQCRRRLAQSRLVLLAQTRLGILLQPIPEPIEFLSDL